MMRLGISLQSGYLIILASLIILMGAGTIYGLWAQGRAKSPEAVQRLAVVNARTRMGWWLIAIFAIAWWFGQGTLTILFAVFSCCANLLRSPPLSTRTTGCWWWRFISRSPFSTSLCT